MKTGSETLFFYGSLMSGQSANRLLVHEGASLLGSARLSGYGLYDLGAFPAIALCPFHHVLGEAWRVPLSAFPALDRYEGEGSLYTRQKVLIEMSEKGFLWVYTYVYLGSLETKTPLPASEQPWRKAGLT